MILSLQKWPLVDLRYGKAIYVAKVSGMCAHCQHRMLSLVLCWLQSWKLHDRIRAELCQS